MSNLSSQTIGLTAVVVVGDGLYVVVGGGVEKWREEGAAIDCGQNGGKTMTGGRHVAVIVHRNSHPSALVGGQYSFKHDSKK